MLRKLQGVLPIVHTPFTDDDEIDEAALVLEQQRCSVALRVR